VDADPGGPSWAAGAASNQSEIISNTWPEANMVTLRVSFDVGAPAWESPGRPRSRLFLGRVRLRLAWSTLPATRLPRLRLLPRLVGHEVTPSR